MDIYDYEKACEISSDERFKMYIPINMNGHRINNLQNPRTNQWDAMSYSHFTTNYTKVNSRGDLDCLGKRLFIIGNYTTNKLMTGLVANSRYLRKDFGDIYLNGLRLYNVGFFTNADQLITGLVLRQKSYSSYIFGTVKNKLFLVENQNIVADKIYIKSITVYKSNIRVGDFIRITIDSDSIGGGPYPAEVKTANKMKINVNYLFVNLSKIRLTAHTNTIPFIIEYKTLNI